MILLALEFVGLARHGHVSGDRAVLEIYTLHASKLQALLGPYSRFQWNHPGPIYFYLLAPLYALTGKATYSLHVTALIINVAAVAGIIRLHSIRSRTPIGLILAFPLMAIHLAFLDNRFFPSGLSSIWNPLITVLPFLLLLLLCANTYTTGDCRSAPLIALLFAFLVQTHIAYFPAATFALMVGCIGMIWRAWHSRSLSQWLRHNRLQLGAASVLFLAPWAPAILEEIKNEPGNLSRILAFFLSQPPERHGIISSLTTIQEVIASASSGGLVSKGLPGVGLFLLLFFALGLAAWLRRGRIGRYAQALLLLSAGGVLIGVYSANRIVEEVYWYLVIWVSGFGFLGLLALIELLPPPNPGQAAVRRTLWLCIVSTGLLSIFLIARPYYSMPLPVQPVSCPRTLRFPDLRITWPPSGSQASALLRSSE